MKNKETMLEDSIIKIEDVQKVFRVYKNKKNRLKQVMRWKGKNYYDEIVALERINLEVYRGESLGIVGSNGSGKSTLLQLICGTLSPTKGNIDVRGKIAALLELGSGFNPEFTGRENIYLNGILMGLTKKQVDERIERIIDFAEIGEFIDREVKFYSSGMIVRLAFAVITNVDAEVLIIDEALAVGDAYFTQKCMRFIQRFRKRGTVVFVSHDPVAVMSLCDKAILIERGQQLIVDSSKKVIEKYTKILQDRMRCQPTTEEEKQYSNQEQYYERSITTIQQKEGEESYKMRWTDYRQEAIKKLNMNKIQIVENIKGTYIDKESYGGADAKIIEVSLKNWENTDANIKEVNGGEIVMLEIISTVNKPIKSFIAGFILKNDKGLVLLGDNTYNKFETDKDIIVEKEQRVKSKFVFTLPMLSRGKYSITASIAEGDLNEHNILHWLNDAIIIDSRSSSIGAGLAGVPMHSINIEIDQS